MLSKILRIINQFLFMLLFTVFALLSILNGTIFNQDYIIRKIDKSNYVANLTNDIKEEVQNYTIQSGFSKDLFDEVFKEEHVRYDLIYVINNSYKKKKIDIDYTNLKNELNNKINIYLQEKNAKADQTDLDKFVSMICDVYKTKLTIGGNLKYLGKMNKPAKISLVLIPILIISMIFILIDRIKRKDMKFLISPILASSMLLIFINIYVKENIDIKNILIFGENFSRLFRNVIYSILKYYKYVGIISILVILLMSIIDIKTNKKA